jgi:hypothetical protein
LVRKSKKNEEMRKLEEERREERAKNVKEKKGR